MAKIGYLRPWWLWLGAFAALMSAFAVVTSRDENTWIGAAAVGALVFVGGVLGRLLNTIYPAPHPRHLDVEHPAHYVGAAIFIAGLAIGLTVSEFWTTRGDYTLVGLIAAVWIPTVIVLMRRFPSRAGANMACSGSWTAVVFPLGQTLPESLMGVSRPLVAGLAAGFLILFVQWAWSVGRTPHATTQKPVLSS